MRYTAALADRAAYRRDLDRAAQRGGREFLTFLRANEALFAPQEWSRVLKMSDVFGSNLARLTHQKFLSYRGLAHDPQIDGPDYPTVIETLITPHAFLRHALLLGANR